MNNNILTAEGDEVPSQKTAIVTTSGAVLGALIIKLRTDKGMTQGDLAAAVGVGPSTWSRIERGESGLSIEQLKIVARILGETPWHLLQRADDEENELKKRGIYIDESFSSPKALADTFVAGKGIKDEGVASGVVTGAFLGSVGLNIMGGCSIASPGLGLIGAIAAGLEGMKAGREAIGAVMPIAGGPLAAMLSISKTLHDEHKTEGE